MKSPAAYGTAKNHNLEMNRQGTFAIEQTVVTLTYLQVYEKGCPFFSHEEKSPPANTETGSAMTLCVSLSTPQSGLFFDTNTGGNAVVSSELFFYGKCRCHRLSPQVNKFSSWGQIDAG